VTKRRLVVIGGDAGGMSAASQARRRATADELEIIAFERGDFSSYSACGIPYFVGGLVSDVDDLIARSPEEHRRNGIDLRMRTEVVAIDVEGGTVTAREIDSGHEVTESYDDLVIATGATPIRPPLPGIDAQGVHGVQTLGDGTRLRDDIVASSAGHARVVVVGGGYVGLELAESLHHRGLPVTIVDARPQPMPTFDPDMGALVADAVRGLGIELISETKVDEFVVDATGHVRAVVIGDRTLDADIVVLGLGVKPNATLARAAGIDIGASGGIATDARMATSAAHVWAAGDCIECHHRVSGRQVAIALGTHANKQGRVVGINVTGGDAAFAGVVGTAVTKICDYEFARTGLNEREAREAGFDFATAKIEATTRAGYYPGAAPITVKVVVERPSGRLLGAQIVGREGAAKRVDVLATAIWNDMTVEEIQQLDLGYAPPFSPVWDPVLVAARRAARDAETSTDPL
jgi:NADPH-dependent 2,4-dienoyl-CoA reductase/sulfur reductase-like enzyme